MLPIILFVLILIIAGAIARQGMLSAFLHMICVVSAGAIALGLLEPLGYGLLDSVGGFAAYMAGTTLILVFLISLLVLRLSMDSLVPDNLNFNKSVDWVGAAIFALCGRLIDAMQHPLYGPIQHSKDPAGGEAPPQTEGYGVIYFCCVG